MRFEVSSDGRGAGEQWVREMYAEELRSYRSSHVNSAILAIVDGDTLGVRGRVRQFDQKCTEKGIPPRTKKEKVAIIVPNRNIETWIKYVRGNQVDEKTVYRKEKRESACKKYVIKFAKKCNIEGLPEDAPESLRLACDEYRERVK